MNGIYWGTTALALLGGLDTLPRTKIIESVMSCYKNGGFSGHVDHDAHILFTLSAVQILATLDALDNIDTDEVMAYVVSLQNEDGSVCGDTWGETDTRFSYVAVSLASLLQRLPLLNPQTINYIVRCQHDDGGFGSVPGAESHAGQSLSS